jgi:single-strand DNA-binding protein
LTPSLRRHAAALRAVAASAATRQTANANQAPAAAGEPSTEGPPPMSSETTITVTGNLVDDAELRFTPAGQAVTRFRIASTPRYRDNATGEWKDGDTLFLTCQVWRQAAENVAESLQKGMRAIVTGRLRQRTYETQEGEKRTVYELQADEVGVSLRNATAKVTRASRTGNGRPAGDGEASGSYSEPPF